MSHDSVDATAPASSQGIPDRTRSDAQIFWEDHVPALLRRGRDTTIPELDIEACFQLSGDGGGEWSVRVRRGRVETVAAGRSESASTTISMTADDFVAVARGEADHRELFFASRVAVEGELELVLWCANLIPVLRERFPFDPAEYRSLSR